MSKKCDEFIEIAKPDDRGYSKPINIDDLPQELKDNNGKAWSREDDLGKKYYMIKEYEIGTIDTRENKQESSGRFGKLKSIQLVG